MVQGSAKEKAWFEEYFVDFNATAAARRVGYKHPNVMGPRKKKKFAKEIEQRLKEKVLEAEEILSMLADIATFNPSEYVVQKGSAMAYIDANKMIEDGYGHLIRSAYTTRDGPRIEIADQDWAKKVVLDHLTKGPAGTKEDPFHITYVEENRPDADDGSRSDD